MPLPEVRHHTGDHGPGLNHDNPNRITGEQGQDHPDWQTEETESPGDRHRGPAPLALRWPDAHLKPKAAVVSRRLKCWLSRHFGSHAAILARIADVGPRADLTAPQRDSRAPVNQPAARTPAASTGSTNG